MLKYIIRRSVQMIVILFVVSVLVLMLTNLIGDSVDILVSENATTGQAESVRARLGPGKPLPVQHVIFLKDVLHGDSGKSYIYGRPAMDLILERMPVTMELVATTALLMLVIAIPLGVYTGTYPKRVNNEIVTSDFILGISLPSFWVGMMMIYIFVVTLDKLPALGRDGAADVLGMNLSIFAPGGIRFTILLAITPAITNVAATLHLTRSGILESMRQDYTKSTGIKGVLSGTLLFGHAPENALVPAITIFGMDLGNIIALTTIVETISAWPSMGKLPIDVISKSDKPIIMVCLMAAACISVILDFVVNLLHTLIDPRIELR